MAAAYDSAGNVNPAFAADINNFIMAMAQAQCVPGQVTGPIVTASAQIGTDAITGIASQAVVP